MNAILTQRVLILPIKNKSMYESPEKPDGNILLQLVNMQMPFGRYKGILLCDLPVSYLEWFQRKGFPAGKLGVLLSTMYEIKMNGLEALLKPLKPLNPINR
jgi:uncharacterized protein (DUF3820 family)